MADDRGSAAVCPGKTLRLPPYKIDSVEISAGTYPNLCNVTKIKFCPTALMTQNMAILLMKPGLP